MKEEENKLPKKIDEISESSEISEEEAVEEQKKEAMEEDLEQAEIERDEKAKKTDHVDEMQKKREELRKEKGEEDLNDIRRKNKDGKGFCPKCGAYVGAYYACTWCKTKMPHANRLRATQVLTVLLMIAGLVSLSFYAQIEPAPRVNIGDIGPTYSYGILTIEGNVTNIDYREARDGSWSMLIFTVEDETGSIDIRTYTDITRELINTRNTPALGDQVSVRGSVFIRGYDLYLQLEASFHLKIERPVILETTALDLVEMYDQGETYFIEQRVRVNGTVTQIGGEGAYFDLDNELRVYIPEYVRDFSPDKTMTVIPGDFVEVVGFVEIYFGFVQVVPGSLYDVTIQHGGGDIL